MPLSPLLCVLAILCGSPDAHPAAPSPSSAPPPAIPEFGRIAWQRDFAAAEATAKSKGLPLLVLFSEVPGCSTCRNYGAEVLSDPLLVEAAETLFVPVAVRNNTTADAEAAVRERFREPAWNNPVVRILGADGQDLVAKIENQWSAAQLAGGMVAALEKAQRPVPMWLRLVRDEAVARRRGIERAVFSMHCFWVGEGTFGGIDGVIATRPGFVDGAEVVEVSFDPTVISFEKLASQAMKATCADSVWTTSAAQATAAEKALPGRAHALRGEIRPDGEPKYYLLHSRWKDVPMTELQATRVNAALAPGRNADGGEKAVTELLSPRQLAGRARS